MKFFSVAILLVLSALAIFALSAVILPARQSPAEDQKTVSSREVLSNSDVQDLVKIGLATETIVDKIRSSHRAFDTTPASLKIVKDQGTPEPVILAMIDASRARDPQARHPHSQSKFSDFVPVFVALLWPLLIAILAFAWRREIMSTLANVPKIVDALAKKIESPATKLTVGAHGATIEPVDAPSALPIFSNRI